MKKGKLYEIVQALEAKISSLNSQLYSTTSVKTVSKINPQILNSASYQVVLTQLDKIQASNRYITDIPELYLPSNKLELMFYLYGSLCFFKHDGRILVTTYAKTGELNPLGDLKEVQPIDFGGKSYDLKRTVVYSPLAAVNPCVIIDDYTGAYTESQIIPKAVLNAVSINDQGAIYTQLKNSIKLTAKKVLAFLDNQNQKNAIGKAINDVFNDDNPVIAIEGAFNEMCKIINLDTKLDIEGYLRAIEAFERLRANSNGIKTRQSVEKKERSLKSEAENDNLLTEVYLYDGLINRQVGIELMKKHGIITKGSCKINPIHENVYNNRQETEDNNENS